MKDVNINMPIITIIDRLRIVEARLIDENNHSDAVFVEMAMQALRKLSEPEIETEAPPPPPPPPPVRYIKEGIEIYDGIDEL